MARAARYIKDKRLLKLLRAFLNIGIMSEERAGLPGRVRGRSCEAPAYSIYYL